MGRTYLKNVCVIFKPESPRNKRSPLIGAKCQQCQSTCPAASPCPTCMSCPSCQACPSCAACPNCQSQCSQLYDGDDRITDQSDYDDRLDGEFDPHTHEIHGLQK